jgi:uncharacterized protein (UPF0333 family)
MSKKTKLLILFLLLLLIVSLVVGYVRFFVFKNYIGKFHAECDTNTEICFIQENCIEALCDKNTYKIIKKPVKRVYDTCGANLEECMISCLPGEKKCEEITCDTETAIEEGAVCSNQ